MVRLSLLLVTLPLILLAGDAIPADDAPYGMVVKKAAVRFRSGGAGDSIRIKAIFSPRQVPNDFDPSRDVVEVAIGSRVLISLPNADAFARSKIKAGERFSHRETRSDDREGVRKLTLDTRRGRVCLKVRRLDLSSLLGSGGESVVVTLTLGATRFDDTIQFDEGKSALRYTGPIEIPGFEPRDPPSNPPVDPPDDPPDDPPGSPPGVRILWTDADLACGMGVANNQVITDPYMYDALWTTCLHPPVLEAKNLTTQPAVDFSKEIVVVIYIGIRWTTGYSVTVTGVKPSGSDAIVRYRETVPGTGCAVSQVSTWPFVVAAIEKVSGTVAFSKDPDKSRCP